jgi:hypothetical protein
MFSGMEVLAKGSAWSPTLRTEPGKIYLHYFKDEACVKEVVLSFVKRKWRISEIGEACD